MNRLTTFALVLFAAAALAACGGSPETPQAPAPPEQVAPPPATPAQNLTPEAPELQPAPAPVELVEEPEPTPPPPPRRVERPRAQPQAPASPPPAPRRPDPEPVRQPDPEPVEEVEPPRTQPTPPRVDPPAPQEPVIPPSPPRRAGDVWVGENGEPVTTPPPPPGADRAPLPPDARRDVPLRTTASPVVLPAGTPIEVRLAEEVSTKLNQTGDRFNAILERDLEVDGRVVARRGDRVTGSLRDVDPGGRVKGVASMTLVLDRIEGRENSIPIQTNEIGVEAQSGKKKDAATVGAAAGIGALIGAIAGGKKGAAIGAAIGGGAGTAKVITSRGAEAIVEREQLLSFRLERDVTVSP